MQVFCKNCNKGYEIDPEIIPENGRKLRCANCGEVFLCTKEDLIEEAIENPLTAAEDEVSEPITADINISNVNETKPVENNTSADKNKTTKETDDDIDDIFKRLSKQTEELFVQESALKPHQKALANIKRHLGFNNKNNIKIYIAILVAIIALTAFSYRYEIVRVAPFTNYIYKIFGINAKIVGEGLEFQNVTRREYEEDFVKKMEIKGFIVNKTNNNIEIPTVKTEMLDKEARFLHASSHKTVAKFAPANSMAPFTIIISKPSPLTKYILLTFIEEENKNK